MNKNKNKGKSFEREIAALFSKVYGLSFMRVPNSGAFVGGKNAERIAKLSANQTQLHKGDIIPPDEMPNLIIECKARKTFPFHKLFSECKELNEWIDQVETDWKACDKKGFWMIIFKPDRLGYYACFPHDIFLSKKCMALYTYNSILYSVIEFDENWLNMNKEQIKNLCCLS